MLSVVICTVNSCNELENLLQLISQLSAKVSNPKQVEVVIKFDNNEQKSYFYEQIAPLSIPFRIEGVVVIRSTSEHDYHTNLTQCYLSTWDESNLIISLPENTISVAKDWDKQLYDAYAQAQSSLGHSLFTLSQGKTDDIVILSREWIDIIGGFGHIPDIAAWQRAIHHYLVEEFNVDYNHTVSKTIFKAPEQHALETVDIASIGHISRSLAQSLYLLANRSKRMDVIENELKHYNVFEASDYISHNYQDRAQLILPFVRHFTESDTYVLRQHTVLLLDVMATVGLYQKNELDIAIVPDDWRTYLDNWFMDDMHKMGTVTEKEYTDTISEERPYNVSTKAAPKLKKPPSEQTIRAEDIIHLAAKNYGRSRAIKFILKRTFMHPIRQFLKKSC